MMNQRRADGSLRHLITLESLGRTAIETLLDRSQEYVRPLGAMPPSNRTLAGRTIDQLEAEMISLIPAELQGKIEVQSIVVPDDPTEELLYQSRAKQVDMIVLGAQGASAFAAVARQGIVYKVLAHSHCPVLTLSPVVLSACGAKKEKPHHAEVVLAGVF